MKLLLVIQLLFITPPRNLFQNSGGLVTTREVYKLPGHDNYKFVWDYKVAIKTPAKLLRSYIKIAKMSNQ